MKIWVHTSTSKLAAATRTAAFVSCLGFVCLAGAVMLTIDKISERFKQWIEI